jgi:septal ring factor EnvC (AmiA/AmiB activator)
VSDSDVLTELRLATDSLDRLYDTQRRHNNAQADETAKLWQELAELRDEVLAVSNRLERLTQAVTASPEQVADAMWQAAELRRRNNA